MSLQRLTPSVSDTPRAKEGHLLRHESRATVTFAGHGLQSGARVREVPSILKCMLLILALKLSLFLRGFARTLQSISRRSLALPEVTSPDWSVIQATEHAVATAAAFY